MKIKRQKRVQRILDFYKHNFGHHPPYQMLIDGTFTKACLDNKINIKEQMPKYIGQEVKLLTTKCAILEAEMLGPAVFGATIILKQFAIHKCGHDEKSPKPAMKCLKSMLQEKNPQRYFIVTQDFDMRAKVRKVPGTPVLYLHHKALTLEKPSEKSDQSVASTTEQKLGISEYQANMIAHLKKDAGILEDENSKKRRRKKKGGPNPLSCLKKKKKHGNSDNLKNVKDKLETGGKKRKRQRNKKKKLVDVAVS